jgi:SAM-dependent methyltransferase
MARELYEDIYSERFSFGSNWQKFLERVDDQKIAAAKQSLTEFTKLPDFKGKVFVDIGCGSGLFSLAASLLGAKKVISMDVDRHSLACAEHLRERHKIPKDRWVIQRGSALDPHLHKAIKDKPDIVYSWGVLHHTGSMYEAIQNVAGLVPKGKLLYIAIYNKHEGFPTSNTWLKIKRFYSKRGRVARKAMRGLYMGYFTAGMLAYRKNPVSYVKNYPKQSARGMDFYRDVEDWLGGYPYEFASVQEITAFLHKDFKVLNIKDTKREGCNEFLFVRK